MMSIKLYGKASILSLAFLVSACDFIELFPGDEAVSQGVVSDILVKGASLSTDTGDFPDTVNTNILDDIDPVSISSDELSLKFWYERTTQYNVDLGSFYFSFSIFNGSDYELLKNIFLSNGGERDVYYVELFESSIRNGLEDIIDIDDFYGEVANMFIPINATHVELRFSRFDSDDYPMLGRYTLADFEEYEIYIKPIIDAFQLAQ